MYGSNFLSMKYLVFTYFSFSLASYLTGCDSVAAASSANLTIRRVRSTASSKSQVEPPYDIAEVNEYFINRTYIIQNESSVCKYMQDPLNSDIRNKTNSTFQLMRTIRDAFYKRRDQNSTYSCNLSLKHIWVESAMSHPMAFQIGQMEQDCFSYIHIDEAVKQGEFEDDIMDNIIETIRLGRSALTNATKLTDFPEDGKWNDSDEKPYENISRELKTIGQVCHTDTAFAYFVNSEVYVRVAVTNKYPKLKSENYKRQNVIQFVPSDFSEGLKMIHREYQSGKNHTSQNGPYVEGQTLLILSYLSFEASTRESSFDDEFGAVRRAELEAEDATDRGMDALTTSNIAIVVLPLAMNLIPIAFVADLATKGMIIYILFTDVLSTVPFLLKGVELVQLGQRRRPYATAFFAGNRTLAQLEVWATRCESDERYKVIGIAFITTAVLVMVLGVLLEIWAARFIRKRKENAQDGAQVSGPFGRAARDLTRFGFFGSGFGKQRLTDLPNEHVVENEKNDLLNVGSQEFFRFTDMHGHRQKSF